MRRAARRVFIVFWLILVMVPLSFVRASQLSALTAGLSGFSGKIVLLITSENDW